MITVTREMIVEAIRKAGEQPCVAYDRYKGCAYRGPNGSKCVVGHLIPDDVANRWDKYVDSNLVGCLSADAGSFGPVFSSETATILSSLQLSHDTAIDGEVATPEDLTERLMNKLNELWPNEGDQ